jgi:hypothetical protein
MPPPSANLEAAALASGVLTVDPKGRVWRHMRFGRPCKPYRAEGPLKGYLVVTVYLEGRQRMLYAHRLAHVALVGPIPDGHLVLNRNGDRHDNRPENLKLVPRSESPNGAPRRAATGGSE